MYYLDIALYISKRADKEFNVFDKCVARYVHFTFPSQRTNGLQRTSTEKIKTGATLNVRILVEEAIRHLRRCRIISNEMSVSHLTKYC